MAVEFRALLKLVMVWMLGAMVWTLGAMRYGVDVRGHGVDVRGYGVVVRGYGFRALLKLARAGARAGRRIVASRPSVRAYELIRRYKGLVRNEWLAPLA
eukprot:3616235-Pyramimonas_sp.AAC.1